MYEVLEPSEKTYLRPSSVMTSLLIIAIWAAVSVFIGIPPFGRSKKAPEPETTQGHGTPCKVEPLNRRGRGKNLNKEENCEKTQNDQK